MAHIQRKYIDKHWSVFMVRGLLAGIFGLFALFSNATSIGFIIALASTFLLAMGIIDATSALYNSTKKRGWITSVIDALIDVVAALALIFFANGDLTLSLIVLSLYTIGSGIIDLFHGFLSTVDPTDRFIRILAGGLGCVIGAAILNAGGFELMTFMRFFGAYTLIVGVASLIYGIHNRSQDTEDRVARKETGHHKSSKVVKNAKNKKKSRKKS